MSTDLTILSPAQKQQFEWAEYLMKPETKQNEAVIKLPVSVREIITPVSNTSCGGEFWRIVDANDCKITDLYIKERAHAIAHALNSQGKLVEAVNAAADLIVALQVKPLADCNSEWSTAVSAIQGAKE